MSEAEDYAELLWQATQRLHDVLELKEEMRVDAVLSRMFLLKVRAVDRSLTKNGGSDG